MMQCTGSWIKLVSSFLLMALACGLACAAVFACATAVLGGDSAHSEPQPGAVSEQYDLIAHNCFDGAASFCSGSSFSTTDKFVSEVGL